MYTCSRQENKGFTDNDFFDSRRHIVSIPIVSVYGSEQKFNIVSIYLNIYLFIELRVLFYEVKVFVLLNIL